MKVLIIGLGSIGKRHVKLLKEFGENSIFCYRTGKGRPEDEFIKKYGLNIFHDFKKALSLNPDFAIVSNPTSLHIDTALILAEKEIPFLLEKPVSDKLDRLDHLQHIVNRKKLPVMIGFQLRHHPGYKKFIELIQSNIGTPLNLQGHVGQFLEDWRPEIDYRQSYSAHKELGGGVILDLIHEIDIALSIQGKASQVSCMTGHYSALDIETEDMAEITIEHQTNRLSHIHLDYLERSLEWSTRVIGTNGTAIWNYSKGYTQFVNNNGVVQQWDNPVGFERDWLFRDQLKRWIEVINGKKKPSVSLDQGIEATRLALAAKQSSIEKKNIIL